MVIGLPRRSADQPAPPRPRWKAASSPAKRKDGTCYQDLGEAYRRPRNPAHAAANLANRIRAFGDQVDIRRPA
jgi:hypothetical protein